MDALGAHDAVGESNAQLVRQVGSDQRDGATPCTEWNVRSLAGHLIMGRQLLVQLVAGCVVRSWDLATATGVDPGPGEQLIEPSYEFCLPLMQKDAVYAYGWFKPPASPLPEGATALARLLHLLGR